MLRNILLFILVLVLSGSTANIFGNWYDHFSPQYGSLFLDGGDALLFAGFFFSYIFFLTFIFKIFALGNKNKLIIWLMVPAALLFIFADFKHIYLPIILALTALGISNILCRAKIFKNL